VGNYPGTSLTAAGVELASEVQRLHAELEVQPGDCLVLVSMHQCIMMLTIVQVCLPLQETAHLESDLRAGAMLQVAASAQRAMQERLRDLEVLNEELVIAKNAMLNDLMVRATHRARLCTCTKGMTTNPGMTTSPASCRRHIMHIHDDVMLDTVCVHQSPYSCRWMTTCKA
jgi:hypothetical protein